MIMKKFLQMFGAEEGDDGNPHDPQQAAQRRKQLVFELNRSGQYLRLKEQLKAGVVAIVKESYHKSGSMGRQEMQASLTRAAFTSYQPSDMHLIGALCLVQTDKSGM